jgi:phage gp16-like protein
MAKAALSMDDETYKSLLVRLTGHESASKLDLGERTTVLNEFQRLGWAPKMPKVVKTDWRAPRIRLIQSLWRQLCTKGIVKEQTEDALLAFCKTLTGVERLEWTDSKGLNDCIEALKSWQYRTMKRGKA